MRVNEIGVFFYSSLQNDIETSVTNCMRFTFLGVGLSFRTELCNPRAEVDRDEALISVCS
jgi:hypothetical protein